MISITQDTFYKTQILMGVLFVGVAWYFLRSKTPKSNFRIREADRKNQNSSPESKNHDDLATARLKQKLCLPGIRIDGPPHEVLGIPLNAKSEEIQRAYRELMKRFHPDRVGRPGSREWTDAQKIAEAINRAKEEMLRRRQ